MDFTARWFFWFGLGLVWYLDREWKMREDKREKKERRKKPYFPVRQALGGFSFVDVRPRRWQYAIHWLRLNGVVSLVLCRCLQNTGASSLPWVGRNCTHRKSELDSPTSRRGSPRRLSASGWLESGDPLDVGARSFLSFRHS